jgi:nitroreductase
VAELDEAGRDLLFREARTQYDWEATPLALGAIEEIYELSKLAPTSANSSPARYVWCVSTDARGQLAACVSEGNRDKVLAAPATVVVGMDLDFHEPRHMTQLFPHADTTGWFTSSEQFTHDAALRNSTLQAAWLMMAARALGYDTGPMSGFDQEAVDHAFWAGTNVRTNFLISVGRGTGEKLFPRLPRFPFTQVNRVC